MQVVFGGAALYQCTYVHECLGLAVHLVRKSGLLCEFRIDLLGMYADRVLRVARQLHFREHFPVQHVCPGALSGHEREARWRRHLSGLYFDPGLHGHGGVHERREFAVHMTVARPLGFLAIRPEQPLIQVCSACTLPSPVREAGCASGRATICA